MLPTEKTPAKSDITAMTALLYGASKFGKTAICAQAEDALFLATEPGHSHVDVFLVQLTTWDQFLAVCSEIAEGKHHFRTIVIDTVDNLHRMCIEHILGKFKIQHEGDLPYGKGHALVANEFARVVNKLALLPYGLWMISHSQEREIDTRTGKITRIVPTLPDRARKFVLALVDVVLFADFEQAIGPDGRPTIRRVLRTKPSMHYDAGDRTGRLPEVLEPDFHKITAAFAEARGRTGMSRTNPTPTPAPSSNAAAHSATALGT